MDERMKRVEAKKDEEIDDLKRRYLLEQELKKEAFNKLEGLRIELKAVEGPDRATVDIWKDKCRQLIGMCKELQEENDLLQEQLIGDSEDMDVVNHMKSVRSQQRGSSTGPLLTV